MAFHIQTTLPPASAAPALARGILLLNVLADQQARRADELTQLTGFPKSSLLRLLETLIDLGLVSRSDDNYYRALASLRPIEAIDEPFETWLHRIMPGLAVACGHTVEWWQPREAGMVLTLRLEAPNAQVTAKAQVGFVRPWSGEMDAVALLGHAHFQPKIDPMPAERYLADGQIAKLTRRQLQRLIRDAKSGAFCDEHVNSNGVRRTAVIASDSRQSDQGVLAIAEVVTVADRPDQQKIVACLNPYRQQHPHDQGA